MTTDKTEPTADDTEAQTAPPIAEPDPVPAPGYAQPVASVPRPADESRPELLIGGAFLGGVILAKLLGRRHGR
jgi:hypothetical protein